MRSCWWEKRKGKGEVQVVWSIAKITSSKKSRREKVRLGKRCLKRGSSDSREKFQAASLACKVEAYTPVASQRPCDAAVWARKPPSEVEPGCSPLAGHDCGLAATDAVLSWAELRRAADKMKHPRVMSAKASHHSHGQGGREEQQRLGLDPELAFPKSKI